MYEYRASLVRVVDGDTMELVVDLGFHITHTIMVRLLDIDTPETRGVQKTQGRAATQSAIDWFEMNDDQLYVQTKKTGKYGRWLARIFRSIRSDDQKDEDKIDYLHDHLIDNGWEKHRFF